MLQSIFLFLLPLIHSAISLSCYQCRRENFLDATNPKYFSYRDIEPLDASCLEEAKPCEEGDDYGMVHCISVTLGPDHAIGVEAESYDVFFCMYFENDIPEEDIEMEICQHEGAEVGCIVNTKCGEDGCNYTPIPHACSTCELPVSDYCQSTDHIDIIQSECELVNCSSGVNQCFISFDQDSCSVNLGCKTPELTDCQSETCSVCEAEETECVLDTSLFCEPGRGCIEEPPHACLTCVHPVCEDTDISGSCDYENCTDGVRECYAQLDSCTITRGCKPPGLTCEDESTTCSICGEDEECSLNTVESCKPEGDCAKRLVCNSCYLAITDIDQSSLSSSSWSEYAKENCSKEDTCKKDTQQCVVYVKDDECEFTVGCNENMEEKDGLKVIETFLKISDLFSVLDGVFKNQKDLIEKCQIDSEANTDVKCKDDECDCAGNAECDHISSANYHFEHCVFRTYFLCSIFSIILNYVICTTFY